MRPLANRCFLAEAETLWVMSTTTFAHFVQKKIDAKTVLSESPRFKSVFCPIRFGNFVCGWYLKITIELCLNHFSFLNRAEAHNFVDIRYNFSVYPLDKTTFHLIKFSMLLQMEKVDGASLDIRGQGNITWDESVSDRLSCADKLPND